MDLDNLTVLNKNAVSIQADRVVVLLPQRSYTPEEALQLAAQLLVMAEIAGNVEESAEIERAFLALTHRIRNA